MDKLTKTRINLPSGNYATLAHMSETVTSTTMEVPGVVTQIAVDPITGTTTMTAKAQIEGKTRHLRSSWTAELAEDMQSYHGINIEDELAKTLQEEIDWEVLTSMLLNSGWSKVVIPEVKWGTIPWINDNITNKWLHRHEDFFFASEKDASMFALKWA